jgi:hypothetical protein
LRLPLNDEPALTADHAWVGGHYELLIDVGGVVPHSAGY